MAHGGGGPAGAAAAAQYVAAQAAAGFGVPGAAAAGFTIPAQFAGAQPAAADLQAVNIQHEHLVMTWRIPRRYTNLEFLAVGGNGEVARGVDSVTGKRVVIKRIKDPWKSVPQGLGQPDYQCGLRAYRELRLLRYMRDSWPHTVAQEGYSGETTGVQHENIVMMTDCFVVPNTLDPDELDLFLVQVYAGLDLHTLVTKHHNLGREQIRLIMYQVVRGLAFLHSAGIIHRDLKPGNIAIVPESLDTKILDFGMARIQSGLGGPAGAAAQPEKAPMMTGYVSTRYYRAPEIITNAGMYDGAVDMWSVGCILAELISGRILFTGGNHLAQVMLITQLLGMPSAEFLQAIPSEGTRQFMVNIPTFLQHTPVRKPLSTTMYANAAGVQVPMFGTFTQASPEIDLMERIFVFDPKQRITAAQALQHPYFETFHDAMDEPLSPGVFSAEFEAYNIGPQGWFELVCQEIHQFRQRTDIPK